jgi:DNA-binding NarL/FixJ family response regulator
LAHCRAGIRAILERTSDIQVVGEAEDGTEAQQLTADLRPQVLLLDQALPGPRPAEMVTWVRARCPETAVLVHQHSPCLLTIPPQSRRPSPLQARLISYVRRRI